MKTCIISYDIAGYRYTLEDDVLVQRYLCCWGVPNGTFSTEYRTATRGSIRKIFLWNPFRRKRYVGGKSFFGSTEIHNKAWRGFVDGSNQLHIGCAVFTPELTEVIKRWAQG